ncbi:MAG TPA: hypothetical protein VF163_04975 [Micromonosporaceae bacterium]
MTGQPPRRRRRVRAGSERADGDPTGPARAGGGDPATGPAPDRGESSATTLGITDETAAWASDPGAEVTPAERGLRGLVGGGSSQVSPSAALRARDAARPRAEEVGAAERDLVIIRRHWTPRDQPVRAGETPRD